MRLFESPIHLAFHLHACIPEQKTVRFKVICDNGAVVDISDILPHTPV